MKTNIEMMRLRTVLLTLLLGVGMAISAHGSKEKKTGILLVAFGSSYDNAREAYSYFEKRVHEEFPDTEVRWAYTSNMVRSILKKRGFDMDTPAEALAHMCDDGFTRIAVQSLHVIPGDEYDYLKQVVNSFRQVPKGPEKIVLGKPLFFLHHDVEASVQALLKVIPEERKPNEAVVFMGHGTEHAANIYYPGVNYYFSQTDDLVIAGTVEGFPGLKEVKEELREASVKRIWLLPLMAVAGDHAQNDMAGPEADSWKSQLEAEGYEVHPVLKGLAGTQAVADVWISHLKETVHELEN